MKKNTAFSLVELIIVLFIFALFLGVAVPSLFSWTASSQIKSDIATSLELQQIITDAVKSNDLSFSNYTEFIDWTSTSKTNLRNLIMRETGISGKVKIPRQNDYAFFVYLLPPYTVTCLPITKTSNFDSSLSFRNLTNEFLLERYPKVNYPQLYVSSYSENTTNNSASISTPTLKTPTILFPNTTPISSLLNSYVGCLNIRSDYN